MSWLSTWRNQYGSVVELTSEEGGRISGTFRTALEDSAFFGMTVPLFGACHGDVIGFTCAAEGRVGAAAVSYTASSGMGSWRCCGTPLRMPLCRLKRKVPRPEPGNSPPGALLEPASTVLNASPDCRGHSARS
ncbi:avidin/streptavidin family protein [Mesorhizobium sp. M0119]|uniref:avidin/streptavidin family protein n=1 Tax=unclassified Mesorhizobium TaxID=325217 RepID=UPI00333B7872